MATKWSAAMTLKMNLRNKLYAVTQHAGKGIHPGLELRGRRHQKSKVEDLKKYFEKKGLFVSDTAFTISISPWERIFYGVFAISGIESKTFFLRFCITLRPVLGTIHTKRNSLQHWHLLKLYRYSHWYILVSVWTHHNINFIECEYTIMLICTQCEHNTDLYQVSSFTILSETSVSVTLALWWYGMNRPLRH